MKTPLTRPLPPLHQAGVATWQEVANPPLVAGGEGCGLPPGHRSQTRTWPPGRAYSGHMCWPPLVAAHMLPLAPWPSKVQTAEEAGSRPPGCRPSARMPAVRPDAGRTYAWPSREQAAMDAGRPDAGRSDADRPDAGRPDAGRPDAGRPDAGRPDAGASGPLLQRRRPGHKEGPCRPRCWPADKEEAQSGPPVAADWPVPLIPSLT
jgi:hypothetical protein